jgi:hypothetical protein
MMAASGLKWIIISMLTLCIACSDEIAVVKPGAPVPVVFAVFDIHDSVHFVKLSRSFAGESDPYTLAADPSNVFYTDAGVSLKSLPDGAPVNFGLVPEIPRNPGLFPSLPNQAYRLKGRLGAGTYRLEIQIPAGQKTLSADFNLLESFAVLIPKPGFKRFYFYDDPNLFSWKVNEAAGLFEISFLFSYIEVTAATDTTRHTIRFTRQIRSDVLELEAGHYNYRFYSDPFFAWIASKMPAGIPFDYRKPVDLSLEITAADTTLARYLNWFNLEIDDQVNPNGNIQGAIGVAASKCTIRYPNLVFSPRAQDSLVRGRYTGGLGFVANSEWQ